jgi:hypothetical protein
VSARCEDLDSFFDGELAKDEAIAFRAHLATCDACQRGLSGRAQEALITQVPRRGVDQRVTTSEPAQPQARLGSVVELAPAQRKKRRGQAVALASTAVAAVSALWFVATTHRRADPVDVAPGRTVAPAAVVESQGETLPAPAAKLSLAIEHHGSMERPGMRSPRKEAPMTRPPGMRTPGARPTLAHAGDMLRFTARGERYRAIWVYFGTRELVAACPGNPRCVASDDQLTIEFRTEMTGKYWIVALGGSSPIIVPQGHLDPMLSAATSTGAHFDMQSIDVY